MRKKFLPLALAIVFCLELAGTTWASNNYDSYEVTGGKIHLVEIDGGFYIYGCDESVTVADLPSIIVDGKRNIPIVAIEDFAFKDCTNLTSVSIPASVTDLGKLSFRGCSNLRELTFTSDHPNYSFSDGVLYNKDKTELFLILDFKVTGNFAVPEGVTTITKHAFKDCTKLTSVTFPNSLTSIETEAFMGCTGLTSITFPNSITRAGYSPFENCTNLTAFYFEGGPFNYYIEGESTSNNWLNLVSGSSNNAIVYYPADYSDGIDGWEHLGYSKEYLETYGIIGLEKYIPGDSAVAVSTPPSTQPKDPNVNPNSSTVLVNGKNMAFDAYTIDGSNYFKLRDLAYVLNGSEKQFEVGWDNASKTITLTSGKSYTANGSEMAKGSGAQSASVSAAKLLIDGKEVSLTAYSIGGANYFKLRDIGQAFDFGIGWDNASKTITIDTSTGYTA